jgi:hypothetical protein
VADFLFAKDTQMCFCACVCVCVSACVFVSAMLLLCVCVCVCARARSHVCVYRLCCASPCLFPCTYMSMHVHVHVPHKIHFTSDFLFFPNMCCYIREEPLFSCSSTTTSLHAMYVYVCMYVYIYVYIYMCVCVCVCIAEPVCCSTRNAYGKSDDVCLLRSCCLFLPSRRTRTRNVCIYASSRFQTSSILTSMRRTSE